VSCSAGVVALEQRDLSAAVLAADVALYAAKQGGRDRFELAACGSAEHPTATAPILKVGQ